MKYILTCLSFATVLLFSRCCTKKACPEMHNVSITFYGFNANELDSVYTTGYAPGSNFGQVSTQKILDDMRDRRSSDSGYYYTSANHNALSDNQDWEIYIPATGKSYRITGYNYQRYSCNNCPFQADDKVNTLSACTINGVQQSSNDAKIYK